jgi:hypothetical protein
MKHNIGCPCGKTFSAETEDEIDLDKKSETINAICDGSFMNYTCPGCGKLHKPEYPVRLIWPSKKLNLEFLPELDRGAFYLRKIDAPNTETIIGFPELADRIAVYRDELEPEVVEAMKYYLLVKAEENYPDAEINIWYQGKGPGGIEFHLFGIRPGETAVSRISGALYEKTLADYVKHPKAEIFAALRTRSYLSIQNTRRPEALK